MARKTDADVALEMYQSVMQSSGKQKKLRSATFWSLFQVKSRQENVVQRIGSIIDEQGLKIIVKSGDVFGKEKASDWIMLSPKLIPPEPVIIIEPVDSLDWPSDEWLEQMQIRDFESEREVEAYFIVPLLEKLGYAYDDIVIGCPVEMFKGVTRIKTEADFVIFNGPERTKENVLLIVEAKKSGINADHIGQARSYAQQLFPACYMVSDGQQILVFRFNGMLGPDERVLDLCRAELKDRWQNLYNSISKEATIQRKQWMQEQIPKS